MKSQRQSVLLDIIASCEVDTQELLTARLIERGFAVTQATVSRDIKDLRLIKSLGPGGKSRYQAQGTARDDAAARGLRIFAESVLSVDGAQNLLVLRTLPGGAQNAAGTLDEMHLPDVLGSIAGDDTILVILRTPEAADAMRARVQEMIR